MKLKAVISITLATLLCLMMLPVSAFAGTLGDVDANGKVDATDARLALRAAVGLDVLSDEAKEAADVDLSGTVDATDARLILRAAVGLEDLHVHSYVSSSVTTAATCEDKGVKTLTCDCGATVTEDIPALGHTVVTKEAVPPTCTEGGLTQGEYCSVCNKVLKEQKEAPAAGHSSVIEKAVSPTCTESGLTQGEYCSVCNVVIKAQETAPALGHSFKTVSLTGSVKCSFPGCDAELPAFNDIVNGLKDYDDGLNYFTGIFEDISHYAEPEIGGTLAGMMEGENMAATTETEYMPLIVDRLITQNNFHSKGAAFVSGLSDKEVKSIKIEKADTVDFVSALPDNFKSGKTEYDISKIKAYDFPEVYKITLVLPEQSIDITKPVSGASVYDKIYTQNYNATLENMRIEVSSGFDALAKEMAGLEGMIKMKNSGNIKASLIVEYYVTADSFTPVAAKYSHAFDVTLDIKVTDSFGVVKYITMLQKMDMTSNSYYFFNNNFGM